MRGGKARAIAEADPVQQERSTFGMSVGKTVKARHFTGRQLKGPKLP